MRTIIPQDKNPLLRQIAKPIAIGDIQSDFIRTLISDMKKLLAKEEHGVAIAAVQVGEPLQLFIVSGKALEVRSNSKNKEAAEEAASERRADGKPIEDLVYINPVLVKMSRGKKEKHEGCLSIRGKWGMVPRAEKATLRAYDESGAEFTRGASGFLAHIFQHEMDHLSGILYTDKAKKLYDDKPEDDESNE